MADPDVRAVAEAFWAAVGAGDWDGAARHLHPDFVQEWPQSGERIEAPPTPSRSTATSPAACRR